MPLYFNRLAGIRAWTYKRVKHSMAYPLVVDGRNILTRRICGNWKSIMWGGDMRCLVTGAAGFIGSHLCRTISPGDEVGVWTI